VTKIISLTFANLVTTKDEAKSESFCSTVCPQICETREASLKWKAQYDWPPCSNQFGSVHFYIENLINLPFFSLQNKLPQWEDQLCWAFPKVAKEKSAYCFWQLDIFTLVVPRYRRLIWLSYSLFTLWQNSCLVSRFLKAFFSII
jgi:hypothetical protein